MDAGNKIPLSRIPKSLVMQSAESIASPIISNILPALLQFFSNVEILHQEKLKCSLIGYLRKLRSLYWNESQFLREPYRQMGCRVFTDVMEIRLLSLESIYLEAVSIRDRHVILLLVLFSAQILFTYEAGYTKFAEIMRCIIIRGKRTEMFTFLMEAFVESSASFSLQRLSTTSVSFDTSKPVIKLIKNAPHLKKIQLVNNICPSVLSTIRTHCQSIEIISLKFYPFCKAFDDDGPLTKGCLFQTFFGNSDMDYVFDNIGSKQNLLLSFPNLKAVNIDNNNCNAALGVNELMLCLQHVYPEIKTTWFKFINVLKPSSVLDQSEFKLPMVFSEIDKYHWDVVEIGYVDDMEILPIPEKGLDDIYPRINHVVLEIDTVIDRDCKAFVEELIKRHNCNSLGLILYSLNVMNVNTNTTLFHNIGNKLKRLYLNMPFFLTNQELFPALNACPYLETLSIEARGQIENSSSVMLNLFPKLSTMRLNILVNADKPSDVGRTLKQQLITSAPHLTKLALSNISDEELENVIQVGCLSNVRTLHLGSPLPKRLPMYVKTLPSLAVLVINCRGCTSKCILKIKTDFQYTALKIYCSDYESPNLVNLDYFSSYS